MNISTNIKLHSIIKEPEAQEIKQAAAERTAEPCPFCGSDDLLLRGGCLIGATAIAIICTNCGCRTNNYVVGTAGAGNYTVTYTATDCVNNALQAWNRRSG